MILFFALCFVGVAIAGFSAFLIFWPLTLVHVRDRHPAVWGTDLLGLSGSGFGPRPDDDTDQYEPQAAEEEQGGRRSRSHVVDQPRQAYSTEHGAKRTQRQEGPNLLSIHPVPPFLRWKRQS